MKIYIVERDNVGYVPKPEVFTDGKTAFDTVKREYEGQMEELGTSQEESDAGYGSYECSWNFSTSDYCGDCQIVRDIDEYRWIWRITEHEIQVQ